MLRSAAIALAFAAVPSVAADSEAAAQRTEVEQAAEPTLASLPRHAVWVIGVAAVVLAGAGIRRRSPGVSA